MLLIRLLILSILFFTSLNDNLKENSLFISPVRIPLLLSANFGELRIDHFHSGLDIKTQGVTGKEVVAAASGYIYRISISPGGFGNALYVRHPSGYSTVYGHLDRFTPEIENYVKTQQYAKKSYTITLFPQKDKFPVEQGELIAFSGNSGGSSGPHLHYEIRKSDSESPVNPLLFDFGIIDNIKPIIEKLVIYPINRYTLINNHNILSKINVAGGDGNYYIPSDKKISISGQAGFGIKAFDRLTGSTNKCAVYSIELLIDSIPVFNYVMDGFSFDESRFINSHIDYETYMKEKIYVERTYILPNDKLGVYKDCVNRGIFNFNDDSVHFAEIIVKDVNNNKSTLAFKIKSQKIIANDITASSDSNLIIMPYNKSNSFRSENVYVRIPNGALYDTIDFTYKCDPGTRNMYSDVHIINNIYTPVQKAYTLAIKPKSIPDGLESKMLIVQLGDDHSKSAVNSRWVGEYLTADALSFGKFYIGIDTIAPVISPNGLVSGANLTGTRSIRIKITDDFSGIKSYEASIDGNWALFEYDQKNNVLIYYFDEKRITKGSDHNLFLKVTDNEDNFSTFNCAFSW